MVRVEITSSPVMPSLRGFNVFLVHDLRQEMVLMDMESLMELAVRGNARSHDFAEAIDIVGVDSQLPLNLGSHFSVQGSAPLMDAFSLILSLTPISSMFPQYEEGRTAYT